MLNLESGQTITRIWLPTGQTLTDLSKYAELLKDFIIPGCWVFHFVPVFPDGLYGSLCLSLSCLTSVDDKDIDWIL